MNTIAKILRRLTGFKWFEREPFELRFRWAEITGGRGLSLALCMFDDGFSLHIQLGWPNIFFKLPIKPRRRPRDGMLEVWGLSINERNLHLNWGDAVKIVALPWAYAWVRTSYLMSDGMWKHETPTNRPQLLTEGGFKFMEDREAHRWKETGDYAYRLKSGELQLVKATYGVSEWEIRQRWLKWTSFGAHVTREIDVKFDQEVGEGTGSWKGGVLGTSHRMKKNEKPLACLRRMERERIFR